MSDEEHQQEVERIEAEMDKYPAAKAGGFGIASSVAIPYEDIIKELIDLRKSVENNGYRGSRIHKH